jgi:VCBS repeat-containing protein
MKRPRFRAARLESLEPRLALAEAVASEFTVLDFEDTAVPDRAWFSRQPAGTVGNFVDGKGDSGRDVLRLAPREGRNGSTALLVESPNAAAGLPGFWIMRNSTNGSQVGNVYDEKAYFVPRGQRANRLEFWVRFEKDFRPTSAASAYVNINVGTYQYDPAKIGSDRVVESDNWHFYHQFVLRHDLAKDGWMHVVLNETPQHQRGLTKYQPANNPTGAAGNYWELATRLYIDLHPYFGEPENGYPARMWVDDIKFSYVPETPVVDVDIEGWANDQPLQIPAGETSEFLVNLTNNSSEQASGRVAFRSHYSWKAALLDPTTKRSVQGSIQTLAPHEKRSLILQFTPSTDLAVGRSARQSVVFVPIEEERPGNASKADRNVQINAATYGISGPTDANIASATIRTEIGSQSNLPPTTQGGLTWYTRPNTPLQGKLSASDPDRQKLTFVLNSQTSERGNLTLNPSTGEFSFVPKAGFKGPFRFHYEVTDGVSSSRKVASWIVVGDNTGTNPDPDTPPDPVPTPNSAPEAGDDASTWQRPGQTNPLAGNLLANDSDPDDDTLTVTRVNNVLLSTRSTIQGAHGSLAVEANGAYSYTLNENDPDVRDQPAGSELVEQFTYQVSDGSLSDIGQLTIRIQRSPETPDVARDDAILRDGQNFSVLVSTTQGFVEQELPKFPTSAGTLGEVLYGDVTGDGLDDVIGRLGSNWYVSSRSSTQANAVPFGFWSTNAIWKNIALGDFNGDGKADVIGQTGGDWWVGTSNGSRFTNARWGAWSPTAVWKEILLADVNGDDRTDLVGFAANGAWWVSESNGSSFDTRAWGQWSDKLTWTNISVGDFNGDGKDDILGMTDGGWWVARSTGQQFTTDRWGRWSTAVTWTDFQVVDLDGDGRDDVLGRTGRSWWLSVSNGTMLNNVAIGNLPTALTAWQGLGFGDFNGDGRDELFGSNDDSWYVGDLSNNQLRMLTRGSNARSAGAVVHIGNVAVG